MAYLEFEEFPDHIEYYTTIGTGALLKEEYATIKNCTLLQDIKNFMYLTQPYFLEDTPNQILLMLSVLILWLKNFYTTIGQYPTIYDLLAITQEEISHWKCYLTYPNKCANQILSIIHLYHHHCTHGRCHITCMI